MAVLLVVLAAGGEAAGASGRFEKPPAPPVGGADSPYASAGTRVPESATEPAPPLEIDRDADGNPYVAGELLVSFEGKATAAKKRRAEDRVDATVEDRFAPIDARLLEVPALEGEGPRALERTIEEIESAPGVDSAGPNYVHETHATVNDAFFPALWGVRRIRAPQAWDRTTGANTVINVLDSGIVVDSIPPCNPNAGHEDIGGVISQFDFFNGDACAEDNNQHGTHTAGTSAAVTNNGVGVAGVSPAGLLLIGKVCEDVDPGLGGSATCPISAQIAGLIAAGNLPQGGIPRPDVINMSLGGAGTTQAQHDAVRFATSRGIVLVVSAGNENDDALKFPASYPEAIAVTSTNIDNRKSAFSNFGPWVDVAAPGGDFNNPAAEDILSTIPFGPATYDFLNGTSMAAPHVTGVASLIAAQGRSASQIRNRIESGARDLGAPGKDQIFGHGLVDANEATLPVSQTRRCMSARSDTAEIRPIVAAWQEEVADAEQRKRKAKKRGKKAKKRLKKADGGDDRKLERKVRRAKRKLKKRKAELAEAHAGLAVANQALAAAQLRERAACSD